MSVYLQLQEFDADTDKKDIGSIIVAGKVFQTTISPSEGLGIYINAVNKILENLKSMKTQRASTGSFNAESATLYNKNRAIIETFIKGINIQEPEMQKYVKVLIETFQLMLTDLDLYYVTGKDDYYDRINHFSSRITDLFSQFKTSLG